MREDNINITEIVDALKKRYKMIIAITLAFTILSAIISFLLIKPKYEVTTKLFIGKQVNKTEQYNSNDVMMYQKLLTTYAEVIKTDDLIERSLHNGKIDQKVKDVEESLTVTPRADTQILEISYRGTNKEEAVNIVKNITAEFIKDSKKLIPNGNIQIIEKAKAPEKAVSPNKKLNIIIAFAIGLIISVGLAIVLEFMDNTYKSKDDLEKALGLPVLGVIPELDNDDSSEQRRHRK